MRAIQPEKTIHPIERDALSNMDRRKNPTPIEIMIPTLIAKESFNLAPFTVWVVTVK